MTIKLSVTEVPPPKDAPINPVAVNLGLLSCMKVHNSSNGAYRCCNCNKMQPSEMPLVEVPDEVRMGDPIWSIIEAYRTNAYNGYFSGWCISCAKKLVPVVRSDQPLRRRWWQIWKT